MRSMNKTTKTLTGFLSALVLLAFCIWKSNIEPAILLPFLALGIVFAVIFCSVKSIRIQPVIKVFSSIFSSLICCGLYYALTYISDLYISKFNLSFSEKLFPSVITGAYDIPALTVSVIAYPAVVFVTVLTVMLLVSGCQGMHLKQYYSENRYLNSAKNIILTVLTHLSAIILAALIGIALLWAAYSIPINNIQENTSESAHIFVSEGPRPSISSWSTSILDNYTDSIILLEASDGKEGSALENALLNHKGKISGADPVQTLIRHFLNNERFDDESPYARYWHGYNTVLKPLLIFLNYRQIRMLNTAVQIVLIATICLLFVNRDRRNLIIPFLLTYLMLMPLAMGQCLQYSSCFYVALITVAVLLCLKREKHSQMLFLFSGAATAYFDLLTFPVMTFGIAAIVFLSLYRKETPEQKLMLTIRNGLCWCAGYAGMWVSKWIITDAVTGSSVIHDAIKTVLLRTSDSVAEEGIEALSVFSVIGRNTLAFAFTPATIAVIFYVIVLTAKRKSGLLLRSSAANLLPNVLLFLLPFFWYTLAANHSMLHFWFTNKALSVTVFSLMSGLSDLYAENACPLGK